MSKIDCSIAINYIKEKARLTENCTISCGACMLGASNTGENMECYVFENNMPEKAVEIMQKWSDENPVKTRREDFYEKFPNAPTAECGLPDLCVASIGYHDISRRCDGNEDCVKCWNEPI